MGVIRMFFILTILATATTPSLAQFPFFLPMPPMRPVPTFPWMPFVGGPESLPPWLKPQEQPSNNAEEFPIPENIPLVGGPDSLPPWLRPQTQGAEAATISWRSGVSPTQLSPY